MIWGNDRPRGGPNRLLRFVTVTVTLAFPCSVAALIYLFAVDVPVEDQWSHALLVDRYLQGEMTVSDWVAPHREHRLLVPRLIWLPLARATHWNLRVEAGVGFLLALATFSILATWWLRWQVPRRGEIGIALISLTLFGWQQWENWLWGAQIQTFGCVLFMVVGLMLLTAPRLSPTRFAAAALAATLAIYSQAAGFVFLAVGGALLVVRSYLAARGGIATETRRGLFYPALWMLLSLLHGVVYRSGSLSSAAGLAPIDQAWSWLRYSLVFLGGPISSYGKSIHPYGPVGLGVVVGAAGLGLFGWALGRRGSGEDWLRRHLFLGGLGAIALGVALLTGLGRLAEGVGQAYSSRYTSYSLLFWLALLLLLLGSRSETNEAASGITRAATASRWVVATVAAALLLASFGSLPLYRRVHGFLAQESRGLGQVPRPPSGLNSSQELVDRGVVILKRHRLSTFSDRAMVRDG